MKKFHLGDIVYPAVFEDYSIDNEDIENMKHIYGVIVKYNDDEDERQYSIEWCDFSTHDETKGYCPKNAWWYTHELTRNQKIFINLLEEKTHSKEEEIDPLTEEELRFLKAMKIIN
jgi:hypothetical protein